MEFTLLAAAVTGVAAMWVTLRATGNTGEMDRLIGAAAVGLLVGRLVAMVTAGVNPLVNPLDIVVVRGGVDTVGATVAAVAALWFSVRGDPQHLDALAPATVAGMAGWHGGCLWRSTCLGAAADVPWGWALPGSEIIRHPVELYAAVMMAAGAVALTRLRIGQGTRAALALGIVAVARLVTEPLRPSLMGGRAAWYAAAVVVVGIAAWRTSRKTKIVTR